MTIPMDNTGDNISGDRAQRLYNKNVELESRRRKAAQARIPSDPNAWQQMRENYESILLEDHVFSEQHDIEYALWQLHYRRIEELRAHYSAALASTTQNGKAPSKPGPDRITKIRSQFKTFLSEATGFYHDLMVKIRVKYGLSLGYLSDDPKNEIASTKDGNKSMDVKKGLISCHRCFIYLGDLARYKGLYGEGDSKARDFAAASSYYMQASSLWPSSGNPHHQLAILASYSSDELLAVYRYFRSLAVDNPFTTARDNLIIAFEKNRQSYSQLLGDSKASPSKKTPVRMPGKGRGKGETRLSFKDRKTEASFVAEREPNIPETFKAFSIRFVRLNGILFTRTSLETFGEVFSTVRNDLVRLLSSGPDEVSSFGADAAECTLVIIRLVAILIFTVYNVNKETGNQSHAEILQRSVVLQNAFTATFEFMAHIIQRCFQLNDPSASYLLPGIMIFVEWLACFEDIAISSETEEKQATARSSFWSNCVLFFNKLLSNGSEAVNEDADETCFFNMSRYDEGETANRLALPEDIELRGFLPLVPAQLILDFSRKHYFVGDGGNKEKNARVQRIIGAGKALANLIRDGQQGIYFDPKSKRFVFGVEPQISDDFSLASSFEIPAMNGMGQENHTDIQTHFGALQSKAQPYGEGEDEDEVIVFKPAVPEKHTDEFALDLASSQAIGHGINSSKVDFRSSAASVSMSHDGFLLEPPTSFSNVNTNSLQPIQPNTSKWLAANGFSNLNLLGNGFPIEHEKEEHLGFLQSTALSVPLPQSVHLGACNGPSVQFPETSIPSKFDSVISSGAGIDSVSMKPSSITSAGLKKNPVSRPIRHFGPPPGFNSAPHKIVDGSLSGVNLKNENPPADDYSWLDGYRFPSSAYTDGYSNSINHLAQSHELVNKSNTSMGMVSFPFPGKQVSTVQVQVGSQNGWHDYQLPEHLKLYHEQQQQLRKENEQFAALPQQYQGQSLWESRFFV